MSNYYPFTISENNGNFVISADIESDELYENFVGTFEDHDYSGNGYSWEGHIVQILEDINPGLLKHIEFDPEAGAFFAYADTRENQTLFVEILSPIFSDKEKLTEYIVKADRERIDD